MSLCVTRRQGGKNDGKGCQGYFATNGEQREQRQVFVTPSYYLVPFMPMI